MPAFTHGALLSQWVNVVNIQPLNTTFSHVDSVQQLTAMARPPTSKFQQEWSDIVGSRLANIIKERKTNAERLARESGVDKGWLSKAKNPKVKTPSPSLWVAARICQTLGISLDWLAFSAEPRDREIPKKLRLPAINDESEEEITTSDVRDTQPKRKAK